MLTHRISSGALVLREAKILLVRHVRPGMHDFWVAPGGGVEGREELAAAAERETREETSLLVRVHRLAYIDEVFDQRQRTIKFWFLADYLSGTLDIGANPAEGESITEAGWFSRDMLPEGPVFPDPLRGRFWDDVRAGFPAPIKLPLRRIQA